MPRNNTPLEHSECMTLVQYMDLKGLMFTHVPNETFTKSWKQKVKNKQAGVRPGMTDYIIIVPADRSRTGESELIFLEMKRVSGSRTSPEQKAWHIALGLCGQNVFVTKGFDEAIIVLDKFIL